MTTIHTAGPWNRHSYGYLVGPDGETPIYLRNATNLLAGSEQLTAEAEANTTLCSAAPELLDALEKLNAAYDRLKPPGYPKTDGQKLAEVAIRKARGET